MRMIGSREEFYGGIGQFEEGDGPMDGGSGQVGGRR